MRHDNRTQKMREATTLLQQGCILPLRVWAVYDLQLRVMHKDRPFLEAAVYANALLLTNNLRDFPFIDVKVIAPEESLSWCNYAGY